VIRFVIAIPVLALGDTLRVGSEIIAHIGHNIAGTTHLRSTSSAAPRRQS